jgi:hypothetical protein
MKIRSRIGAEQDRPQPPECSWSNHTKTRFLHPGRFSGTHQFQLRPARTRLTNWSRQGTAFYPEPGRRAAVPDSTQNSRVHTLVAEATPEVLREISLPTTYEPSSIPQTLPTTKNPREIMQFSRISNRFWAKNRSYRKQTIKPCLTGARTAFNDSHFLRGVRVRRGGRRGMIQRDCRASES